MDHVGGIAVHILEDRGAHALRGMAGEWQPFAVRA